MSEDNMKRFGSFAKSNYGLNQDIGYIPSKPSTVTTKSIKVKKECSNNIYDHTDFGMIFKYDTISRYVDLPDSFTKIWDKVGRDFIK